jgi:hypothetical protein
MCRRYQDAVNAGDAMAYAALYRYWGGDNQRPWVVSWLASPTLLSYATFHRTCR